jgi:hypothetical protein
VGDVAFSGKASFTKTSHSFRYDRVAKKRGPSGPGKRKDVQIKQEDAISSPGSGVESPAPTQLASYSGAQSFSGLSVMSASSSLVSPLQLLRMPQNPANPRDFLPPPEILERLVQVFFENVHPFLPVIHRETWVDLMRNAVRTSN